MDAIRKMILDLLSTFTQQEIEKLTGVNQSDISKIKNSKLKSVSVDKADAIKIFYFSWKQKTPADQS